MITKTINYQSANKMHDIHALTWRLPRYPRAILQIAHGMSEYIERYTDFARFLTQNGFLVCGNDHAGHGESLNKENVFGFFSEKDGFINVIKDIQQLQLIIQNKYPDSPYFMLGHSMGSLLTRYYIAEYKPALSGYICMGTSGGSSFVQAGIIFSWIMKHISGKYTPGKMIDKITFGNYNKRIYPLRTKNDWLSRDNHSVDLYNQDPKSGFIFTNSAFYDLFSLLKAVSSDNWAKDMPDVPILLISGSEDPVGDYGKGVKKVAAKLIESGHTHLELKIYDGARHELLHETNKREAYVDILHWMNNLINS